MGKKVKVVRYVDVEAIGKLGGQATAANRTAAERKAAAKAAIAARWEQYYRDHPEKLAAKKAREARKARKKATLA